MSKHCGGAALGAVASRVGLGVAIGGLMDYGSF